MDYAAKVLVGAFASSHPKSLLFDVCAVEILRPKCLSTRFLTRIHLSMTSAYCFSPISMEPKATCHCHLPLVVPKHPSEFERSKRREYTW